MTDDTAEPTWPGWAWAKPEAADEPDTAAAMREALLRCNDDEEAAYALLEYVADPKHRFDLDETEYSAEAMADMFAERAVEYEDWYQIGSQYLIEHYPGLLQDPLVAMRDEEVSQIGVNIGRSEHEEERYLWVEADGGRVFAIVRPAYATSAGGRA